MGKIRVLVCDDSAFMRMIIKDILEGQGDIEIVSQARDGMEAIEKAIQLKPDVITMDVEMPKLNGLEALKLITKKIQTRVIMVSSLTQEGANITIEALQSGAVDFVPKPSGSISTNFRIMGNTLLTKIREAALIDPSKIQYRPLPIAKRTPRSFTARGKIVLIASSTGGPKSLDQVIPALPKNLPAPVLLVQHMPAGFTASLAQRLDRISEIEVREAKDGDILKQGTVYVAPGDYHVGLRAESSEIRIFLDQSPKINGVRPAADFTFEHAAELYREKTIGVVMTGMGRDGTKGSFKIKHYKGVILAESEETCVVYGMPKSVVQEGYSDYVLPSYRLAEKIAELV
ncbi:MAG TPA: chemotaxis response regulator protein-glutamate methylesterase [Thermotogota bacterium]|nr:chemotaxis response regulator protein-glutamate methylesterase [Thermotogota bacterium]NLZ13323.1 chemotaxis response regulator protein-glutamate methylesterase [Thermotogaceae bacterium]MDD8041745.1 chemotaxis response regulator protein-glutamate methylesterase [Thermotogota bacterium]HNR63428.1 chemotaxis response regulator protein-glutamate methylesterase [Thermotogota bacterium]HNT95351.1 chemotaxis response regulator protein-glutamate methylesterase [Thermotogota bacterium]